MHHNISKDMGEKVRTILIRIVGSLYGVYGVLGIVILVRLVDQGLLRSLEPGHEWFAIPWSFTRAFLCLLVGWFAWRPNWVATQALPRKNRAVPLLPAANGPPSCAPIRNQTK